jgi:hypothetical protein
MTVPVHSADRRPLLGFAGFAGVTLALTAIAGWAMSLGFRGPGDSAAIALSAIIAVVIQLAAFPAIRAIAARNLVAGWGAGSLIRFASLVVYAIAAVKVLFLPAAAALISLFVFYFLSMLVEPFFLRS